jgi:dTDP-glucose pyrophosphorylase
MINFRTHLILTKTPIREALNQLTILGIDAILFVIDKEDKLIGSITDGDVRRGLLRGILIDQPIDDIIRNAPKFIRKGEKDLSKIINYREENFRIVPVLDSENNIINVINFRLLYSYLPIDAVIMAGGRGQRLSPLTDTTPKPLLKVGEKAILEHNLDRLCFFGIDDFWVTINYLGSQIIKKIGNGDDRNIKIKYVQEDKPLGTIGAVSYINNFKHEYILITNSDILTNLNYEDFFVQFLDSKADMAVVTIPYNVKIPYAVLETNNGQVINFKEKPTYTYYSNGGIYLVKKSILNKIPYNIFYNTTDLMETLIQSGNKIFSYPFIGYWLDIGSHEDYIKANIEVKSIKF